MYVGVCACGLLIKCFCGVVLCVCIGECFGLCVFVFGRGGHCVSFTWGDRCVRVCTGGRGVGGGRRRGGREKRGWEGCICRYVLHGINLIVGVLCVEKQWLASVLFISVAPMSSVLVVGCTYVCMLVFTKFPFR